jgi:hypothetical protein
MRVASSRVPRTLVPAPDEGILRRLAERKDVPNLRATPSTASKTELKYMIRRNSPFPALDHPRKAGVVGSNPTVGFRAHASFTRLRDLRHLEPFRVRRSPGQVLTKANA